MDEAPDIEPGKGRLVYDKKRRTIVAVSPDTNNELRAEIASLRAELAAQGQVCGACGQPWTGEKCGQADNGHSFQTCYPVSQQDQIRDEVKETIERLKAELAAAKRELDDAEEARNDAETRLLASRQNAEEIVRLGELLTRAVELIDESRSCYVSGFGGDMAWVRRRDRVLDDIRGALTCRLQPEGEVMSIGDRPTDWEITARDWQRHAEQLRGQRDIARNEIARLKEALTIIADWDRAPITGEWRESLLDIIRSICDCARTALACRPKCQADFSACEYPSCACARWPDGATHTPSHGPFPGAPFSPLKEDR